MGKLAVTICATFLAGVLPLMAQTGNISKQRREELTAKLGEIKDFLQNSGDTNATKLLSFAAELEKELRGKKYGLVFEQHIERVDVELQGNLPTLTEVKDRYLENDPSAPLNFLLEGDNLAALKLLEKTHKGRIDLIYIDPPYNTGNKDFVYNDSYVDKTDTFRHSKWLSFMQKRLEIAKRLMSEKGVIFISIDDNEQAALKLLCDEVFGHEKFTATIPWRKRTAKADVPHKLSQDYEWVLCYANAKFTAGIRKDNRKYYTTPDFPGRPWRVHDMTKQTSANERPNSYFTIVNPKNGKEYKSSAKRTWAVTQETFPEYYKQGRIIFPGDYSFLKIKKPALRYFREDDEKKAGKYFGFTTVSTDLPKEVGMNQDGTKDLDQLFHEKVFSFPKPVSLIKYLLHIATPLPNVTDTTVLDFFAGSGTTGHAVMKLNAEDGGKRNFILVTNNENGICEKITYERLKRVMEKEKYPARLKYMKIDYLPISGKLYYEYADELLQHIRELVELENAVDISHDTSAEIVLTDAELAALVADEERLKKCRSVYIGHDVLVGSSASDAFERHGIEAHRIPQYYYPEMEG